MRKLHSCILAVLLCTALAQGGAWAINVIVNGTPLPSSPPGIERGGRVLLPMRMVFEALGASVGWEDATQTAIGVRGDITVRMSINKATAYINDRVVQLDVAPQLIGGSTYMPVRFPAEAFGAKVTWAGSTQTVTVELAPIGALTQLPIQPPTQPSTQPQNKGYIVMEDEGVLTGARANQVSALINNELKAWNIGPSTIVLRQGQQVTADKLEPGDWVVVQYATASSATMVKATYDTVKGVVAARATNQLLLDANTQPYAIRPDVVVKTSAGADMALGDIRNGDAVTLRVTPGMMSVFGITVDRPTAIQPPAVVQSAGPAIDQFFHDARQPLGPGAFLHVTLQGTPGGRAWFDLGDLRQQIFMSEAPDRPGEYSKALRIEAGMDASGVELVGHLQVNGQLAPPALSAAPVTIDTVPPNAEIFGPARDSSITDRKPSIAVLLSDQNGSGVDYERTQVSITVNGKPAQAQINRSGNALTIISEQLPTGTVLVSVTAFDNAGNSNTSKLSFGMVASGVVLQSQMQVSHDAFASLAPGDTLTVTVMGPADGQARFDLGTWRRNVQMSEVVGQPGVYKGHFTVPALSGAQEFNVSGYLALPDGSTLTAEAPTTVRMAVERPLEPTIDRPTEGAHVGDQVVVEGTTQPLAEVEVKITWRGTILLFLEQTGQIVDTTVTADSSGYFITEPIALRTESVAQAKNIQFTLTVTGKNAGGETSQPVVVNFVK